MDGAADMVWVFTRGSRSSWSDVRNYIYADVYLLHHRDITSSRLRHDIVLAVLTVVTAVMLWSLRRRPPARRQLL
jgi:hypothetical protein